MTDATPQPVTTPARTLYDPCTFAPTPRLQALLSEEEPVEPTPPDITELFRTFQEGAAATGVKVSLVEFGEWLAGVYHQDMKPCEVVW